MIKLLTEDKYKEFLNFCNKDIVGAVIYTRLLAYGIDNNDVMFWYAENNGKMTAACSAADGVFTYCCNNNADINEILAFANIIGAKTVTSTAVLYILKYIGSQKTYSTENIDGENLKEIFPVVFEEDGNRSVFFDNWYTDASHKIRHGLIHGKCVYDGSKCVSAALTSGETEKIAVISSVATMKNYRKRGFGEAVVNSLAEDLKKEVYLMTDSENTALWYKSIGWEIKKAK